MKVQNITIKNFKGIEEAEVDVNGKSVYLIGGNGTGKTSFIDAVFKGVSGKGLPTEPTTNGVKKGTIEIDLGDFIARTKFTKNKPTSFELENKEFSSEADRFVKSPRSYLNSIVGILDFDINEFFGKSDAEQVKYFCKVSGIDFSDLDTDIQEIEDSRRADKKELAVKKGLVTYYNKDDAAREEIDLLEATKKLAAAKETAALYLKVKEGVLQRAQLAEEYESEIKRLQALLSGGTYIDKVNGETTVEKGLYTQIADGNEWLGMDINKPLSPDELTAAEGALETLDEDNKKIREAKAAKQIDADVKKLEDAIDEADKDIEKKKTEKAKRIAANMAVEGLTYDTAGERFLYNGLPFEKEQINTAAQLIAGLKIGAMMLKDLKILKVDASLIDKREFDKVLEWAENNDIQLFVELVDREGDQLKIILHEE